MKITTLYSIVGCAMAMACGACGTATQLTASLKIDSPTNNSTVNVPADKKIAVNFSTNFTLRAPGGCTGIDNCGHAWLLIDSSACNQAGKPYNTLAVSSPAQADLSLCQTVAGMHTITVELHSDTEALITDAFGNVAKSTTTITAQL